MSSESGMNIYMARMYSYMPFEDFKYMAKWGLNFNSWLGALGIEGTGEALNRASDLGSAFTGEDTPYWGTAFTTLRDANYLLERLPDFQSNFAESPITTTSARPISSARWSSTPWHAVSAAFRW